MVYQMCGSPFGNLNPVMGKPVFEVSDKIINKPGCKTTEDGYRV